MKTLRLILGDQLSRSISALQNIDHVQDIVLMAEVHEENTYVKHHKQKIVFVLSAMRHFAKLLQSEGIQVDYVRLDDKDNSGSFTSEINRAIERHTINQIVVTEPGEWRVWEMMQTWEKKFGIRVDIREDDRFFCSRVQFVNWAQSRKSLRMEFFYREMRRKTGWLMEEDKPLGGKWNYDADNRKALPPNLTIPFRTPFTADNGTREVMELVGDRFHDHFGDLESFGWAVTRENALQALNNFIVDYLIHFGDYQDAMKSGEDFLFHSILSPYLNIGLLSPREVCEAALSALFEEKAPLNAVEGFIRQILGWREYLRGIYWMQMPSYAQTNFFEAKRQLPEFYWTGKTEMNCLREVIEGTRRTAYSHHIQRLMITGNYALLAGISPVQVEEWYLIVYADAFEWVELPNTHGMALHADGGLLGSKPYAASGAYINRMSDYCTDCTYNPKTKLGPQACPFNYLYWYFIISNEKQLKSNPRMVMPYRTLSRMTEKRRQQIIAQSEEFLGK
jgi:deoxyribodipyrimidine photolyase-related protein